MDLRSLIAFLETFVTFLGYAILFKSITKYRLAVWEWLVSVLVLPILASGFAVVMLLCFADMDGFKTVMIKNIVVLLWLPPYLTVMIGPCYQGIIFLWAFSSCGRGYFA